MEASLVLESIVTAANVLGVPLSFPRSCWKAFVSTERILTLAPPLRLSVRILMFVGQVAAPFDLTFFSFVFPLLENVKDVLA